jgi:hypothetical protein
MRSRGATCSTLKESFAFLRYRKLSALVESGLLTLAPIARADVLPALMDWVRGFYQ